jgi:hypothetical protein
MPQKAPLLHVLSSAWVPLFAALLKITVVLVPPSLENPDRHNVEETALCRTNEEKASIVATS